LKDTRQPQGLELPFMIRSIRDFWEAERIPNLALVEFIPGVTRFDYFFLSILLWGVRRRKKIKTYCFAAVLTKIL
jgi:hypothetical protein